MAAPGGQAAGGLGGCDVAVQGNRCNESATISDDGTRWMTVLQGGDAAVDASGGAPFTLPGGNPRRRIGLISAWASRLGGGVFEVVAAHAHLIASMGHEPVVFALEDEYSAADRTRFGGFEVQTFPVAGPRIVGFAPGLVPALCAAGLDLLHLHGIWMYPSRAASAWAARTGRPYVISPHGMLDPWILSRGKMKKAVARLGYENASWRRASRFHALTGREADDIAAATGRRDSIVIPNPVAPPAAQRSEGRFSVLYLGRIHPKKNVDALIDAWTQTRDAVAARDAELVIAGWGEDDHVRALEAKLAATGDASIRFVGPAYGDAKARLLADARFLCLASHSEGLPMTVLEAWAAGTPTLMSQHCHLPVGYQRGAAIDTGTAPADIAAALRTALAMPQAEWAAMAAAAEAIACDSYSLESVAAAWQRTYGELMES
jgi:poly(glycerol-phosphate) alpha-glucosyltransferase